MDQIKLLPVMPGVFNVVDQKLHVWGDPGWLDGAEVDANNLRGCQLISQPAGGYSLDRRILEIRDARHLVAGL